MGIKQRKMELSLVKLSIERLLEKVEKLEKGNAKLKKRIQQLEQNKIVDQIQSTPQPKETDILIDTKEVLQILGICYNTLQAIIKKNLITPIRINQRRIRFSKQGILEYIRMKTESEVL